MKSVSYPQISLWNRGSSRIVKKNAMNSPAKLLFLFAILGSFSFGSPEETITSDDSNGSSDTCFYQLLLPPDLDMPETPYFDTTIVRNPGCKVHILRLQIWGTETAYTLYTNDSVHKPLRSAHFFCSYPPKGKREIDITGLPAGKYSMSLSACGNGGSFGLAIK